MFESELVLSQRVLGNDELVFIAAVLRYQLGVVAFRECAGIFQFFTPFALGFRHFYGILVDEDSFLRIKYLQIARYDGRLDVVECFFKRSRLHLFIDFLRLDLVQLLSSVKERQRTAQVVAARKLVFVAAAVSRDDVIVEVAVVCLLEWGIIVLIADARRQGRE